MVVRKIFRSFIKVLRSDSYLEERYQSYESYAIYGEVLAWAANASVVYNSKKTRAEREAMIINARSNILSTIAYKFSKEAMEAFFRDDRLYNLFVIYAEEIKAIGY